MRAAPIVRLGRIIPPLAGLMCAAMLSSPMAVGQRVDPSFLDDVGRVLAEEKAAAPPLPEHLTRPVTSADDSADVNQQIFLGAARNAASQGEIELAYQRYNDLLKRFPDDAETRYEFIGLLMRWGKWQQAEAEARMLVRTDPERDLYLEVLADILMQRQQHSEATAILVELSSRKKLSPRVAIRLGRLLAWQKEFDRAAKVIAQVDDHDSLPVNLRVGLAQYYNESHQPERAIDLATRLKRLGIDDVDVDVLLARAHMELGHFEGASRWVEILGEHRSPALRARLDLADDFYRLGHDRLALNVFQQVMDRGHTSAIIVAKVVAAQTRLLEFPAAETTYEAFAAGHPSHAENPELLAAYANYLVAVGRHAHAERLFRRLIAADPANVDLHNGYAHLWYSMGDYLRAESEYRVSLRKGRGSVKTQTFLARALSRLKKADEALFLLGGTDSSSGQQPRLRFPLIETLKHAGRHRDVLSIVDESLPGITGRRELAQMWTESGLARMRLGDLTRAEEAFRLVLREYDPKSAPATYGLMRVLRRLGDSAAAESIFAEFDERIGMDLSRRMQLADLATADSNGRLAERILMPAYSLAPDNVYLLIRLGEAVSITDRIRGTSRDRQFFRQAVAIQPDNTRARLGLARSYARNRQASQATRQYRQVIADLPGHRLANHELSRIAYRFEGVDSGMASYAEAQRRLSAARADAYVDFTSVFDKPSKGTSTLAEDGTTTMQTAVLRELPTEIETFRAESEFLEQRLTSLERQAKWNMSWGPRQSVNCFRSLIQNDPTNEEAYFDLGQVFGAMNYTSAAANRFCQLLDLNPGHTEACIALRRTQLERSPQWWSDFGVFDESGRDGLTEMRRARLSTFYRLPLGDEREYVYAGYAHEWLNGDYGEVQADVALLGASRRICDDMTIFIDTEISSYSSGFSTRPEFRTGVKHRDCSDIVWTLSGYLENVVSNSESIEQDIYRRGLEFSAYIPKSWRWNLNALYRWGNYSDDNNSQEASLVSEYLLCHGCGRRQWRSVIGGYFYNVDEETLRNDPFSLAGTIHPYWAPRGFAHLSLGLEYKHWLSEHTFKYANQWWWSTYFGGRVDTDGIGYGLGSLRCYRDHCNWLTTGVDASFVTSEVYHNAGIRAYLIVRRR